MADDRKICRVESSGLRRQGYEVAIAANGAEGLMVAAVMTPDFISCNPGSHWEMM
jgi:DNA-binding response OmpR family regulator